MFALVKFRCLNIQNSFPIRLPKPLISFSNSYIKIIYLFINVSKLVHFINLANPDRILTYKHLCEMYINKIII